MNDGICSVEGCTKNAHSRGWCQTHYWRWSVHGSPTAPKQKRTNYTTEPLADRFWRKVTKTDACWIWGGAKTLLGYGSIWDNDVKKHRMAHRVSYEMAVAPIPAGLHIDHLCRNPSCVNPDHLEPVTPAENTRRGVGIERAAAHQRSKTHCPQGHPYDQANTYVSAPGKRSCRTCNRDQKRRSRLERKRNVQ